MKEFMDDALFPFAGDLLRSRLHGYRYGNSVSPYFSDVGGIQQPPVFFLRGWETENVAAVFRTSTPISSFVCRRGSSFRSHHETVRSKIFRTDYYNEFSCGMEAVFGSNPYYALKEVIPNRQNFEAGRPDRSINRHLP